VTAWYSCGFCGARYRNRELAMLCCDAAFDTDDDSEPPAVEDAYGEAPPAGVPPERHASDQRVKRESSVDIRTDGGHQEGPLDLTKLPYQCRNCETEHELYVTAETIADERYIDAHNARLTDFRCPDCDCQRVFVLAVENADAARDGHPIQAVRDLHRKRRGGTESHTPIADGGVPDVPPDATVYVTTSQRGSRHTTVFHTDWECPRLQASNNIHEKTRGVLRDTKTHCKFCAGVADQPTGDHGTYNALKAADPGDLVTDGGGCPQCGAPTQLEGGCPTCTQCPWSKCGGGF
jgi:hypothetical protein